MISAKDFAIKAHGNQMYGTMPYFHHLRSVVGILGEFGYTDDYEKAGWLHDTPEEPGVPIVDIRVLFGSRVARLVDSCYGTGEKRRQRNLCIYQKLSICPEGIPLKVADRISHVEACKEVNKHFQMYLKERQEFSERVAKKAPYAMFKRLEHAYDIRMSTRAF